MRNYQVDYSIYSFNSEDDWGCINNGERIKPLFNPDGYANMWYKCTDGKWHKITEHIAKWEYFNGRIPEGMQIDHKTPIKNGGTNKLSNLRIVTIKENANNQISLKNKSEAMKGRIHSEETKKKISEKRKGSKHSEETKKKISESQKGKHNNNPFSKRVYQYNLNGELIKIWDSVYLAAKQINGYSNGITDCCNGGYFDNRRNKWVNCYKYKGFKWSFEK